MTPTDDSARAHRVYSTETERIRDDGPSRSQPSRRRIEATRDAVPADGIVRISRTSSGRGGKTVTLVTGLPSTEVERTAKELKRLCGTGGTAKDGVVEIQGDHRQRIMAHLQTTYRTKLAGG